MALLQSGVEVPTQAFYQSCKESVIQTLYQTVWRLLHSHYTRGLDVHVAIIQVRYGGFYVAIITVTFEILP
jgi:hypothetical protein